MPSDDPARRFGDIIESIGRIEGFTRGLDGASFAASDQTVFAVKYALLIISEAAIKLAHVAPDLCPDIPWREVRGLGNRLRHGYDTINIERIWLLIVRDLPPMKDACTRALAMLGERGATRRAHEGEGT